MGSSTVGCFAPFFARESNYFAEKFIDDVVM